MIHSTAIIDPSAQIANDVEIGPYSVIGKNVNISSGCIIMNHVTIHGPVEIGTNNIFYQYCSIGSLTQDLKYSGEPTLLKIGNHNSFREFCTVNRATAKNGKTIVGDYNHFLAYSHIAHDCHIGNYVIFSNNGTVGGHVIVEDHATIGGLTGIHQYCRIGCHAIIGACTKISQDALPYMIADGNPAVSRGVNYIGLERRGFHSSDIRNLREAYRLIYRSNLNVRQACEAIRAELQPTSHITHLLAFIESSQRGIVR